MDYREKGKPIPENVLFSWPMPNAPGLRMNPKERATVEKVWENSPAAAAGFRAEDEIIAFEGQPILSTADIQWALQNAGENDSLTAQVKRGEQTISLTLELKQGWRRFHDISWRRTTEILRSRILGGIEYRDVPVDQRQLEGLPKISVALRAARGVSRSSGTIRRDDIVVAVDGDSSYKSEGDLLAYFAQEKKAGDSAKLTLLRGDERIEVSVPVR